MVDAGMARLSDDLFWVALIVYAVAMVLAFAALAYKSKGRFAVVPIVLLWGGAIVHAGSVTARGLAVDRVPWGNMFEYSTMLGLLLMLGYLIVFDLRMGLRSMAGFAAGATVLALATARLVYAPPGPLVPALDSYWLKFHVFAAILGSSLFGLSFIFTVLYLFKERSERRAAFGGSTVGAAYLGTDTEEGMPADHVDEREATAPRTRGKRFPSAETFYRLTYRTIAFAFLVWTFAVLAGAVWAHEAWGRYWGWDPKETWAFITWVVYAGYLHAGATAGWRGRRAAYLSVLGFGCVSFTYWAVNLWIAGLHSYAGV